MIPIVISIKMIRIKEQLSEQHPQQQPFAYLHIHRNFSSGVVTRSIDSYEIVTMLDWF